MAVLAMNDIKVASQHGRNVGCRFLSKFPTSYKTKQRPVTSGSRCPRYDFLTLLLVTVLSSQIAYGRSLAIPLSSSPAPALKVSLGIVVAESCDQTFISRIKWYVDQAIGNFTDFIRTTQGESNLSPLEISYNLYPFCKSRDILSALEAILGNASVDVVLGLARYDVHSCILAVADIYERAYVAVNMHIPKMAWARAVSFGPSFSQTALMLASVLDLYQWQDALVVYTSVSHWQNLATYVSFELTLRTFRVNMGKAVISPAQSHDASGALSKATNSKAVLLFMDVADQLVFLEMASAMSMTLSHAFFSFALSPYDLVRDSVIGLTPSVTHDSRFVNDPRARNVNIFESLFVIDVLFPAHTPMATGSRRKRSVEGPTPAGQLGLPQVSPGVGMERVVPQVSSGVGMERVVPQVSPGVGMERVVPQVSSGVGMERVVPQVSPGVGMERVVPQVSPGVGMERVVPQASSGVDMERVVPQVSSGVGMERVVPQVSSGVGMERVVPQVSPGVGMERVVPQVSPGVGMERVVPQVSSGVDMERVVPQVSSGVGMERVVPQVSSGVGMERVVPQVSSGVGMERVVPQVSPGVGMERVVPQVSSGVGMERVVPQVSSGVGMERVVPQVSSGVGMERVVPQMSSGVDMERVVPQVLGNGIHVHSSTSAMPSVKRLATVSVNSRPKRDTETYHAAEADLKALYDTLFLTIYGIHMYSRYNHTIPLSHDLIMSLGNITFPGSSGEYQIDDQQMVSYDFTVYDFNRSSGNMEPRIFYQARSSEDWTLTDRRPILWPGGVQLAPDDCFKQVPYCRESAKSSHTTAAVISVLLVIVTVTLAAAAFRWYWVSTRTSRGDNKVILSLKDLVFVGQRKASSRGSRLIKSRVTLTDADNVPDIICGSKTNMSSMASINDLSDRTQTARYKGELVHVKELNIQLLDVNNNLIEFTQQCRGLRHENLCPFVGFLAEPLRPAMIMEYCSRGSLYDIIHSESFKLDWNFKLSLLTDLVKGMKYLHSSPLKFHGHLTSKNCVIDNRYVLKVTDYGVSGIMERCHTVRLYEPADLLWSAPELLRDEALLQQGSDKGDIYSLSIIFQEMALRSEPYSTTGLSPEEILKKLKNPPPMIRPSVTPQSGPPLFIQIMKQCWTEIPNMRPNMDVIYEHFKRFSFGKKANIMDAMFKRMDAYSTDLANTVAERTMEIENEQKRTDDLLFKMLPATVAESLKYGRTVEAETFDEVTIYFSDIVGFTTISAMSTPMQVVSFLNDLYSMFDTTISNHDVYKVETIGDAYMVVSGLPVRNGTRHAGEIANLALVLLSLCGKHKIEHMPNMPLRLRIGIHSGPCVAGVVGTTMPRYCLFGDTVNTASRMESTGAAFRIHISEACKLCLDVIGGYKTEFRGQTELKGKGLFRTYWLVGREGFVMELPEPPPVTGDDTHGLGSIIDDTSLDFITALDQPNNVSCTPTPTPTPGDTSTGLTRTLSLSPDTTGPCPVQV